MSALRDSWRRFYREFRVGRKTRPLELEFDSGEAVVISPDREFDAVEDIFTPGLVVRTHSNEFIFYAETHITDDELLVFQ